MKLFGNKRGAARLAKKRAGGRKRRLSGLQIGLICLSCAILALSGAVFAFFKTYVKPPEMPTPQLSQPVDSQTTIDTTPEDEETFLPPTVIQIETQINAETGEEVQVEVEVPASHKVGFYNILIVGTDDDGTRTDTIMIARLDATNHTVALLSIPRDTLVTTGGMKINSVYGANGKGEKGIEALQNRLSRLLGFQVDGYALVNLDAFIELVDLVGGVEFDVPMRMYYSDPTQDLYIDLQAGVQHLDGEQAMGLVRFRKGYASQDIQRTQVQQQFLQALAKQCLSVANLTKIGEMAQIFLDNVTTNLTLGNVVYFGQELLKCDFDHMFTYTLEGEAVDINGASCWAIYQNKTLQAVNDYFNPYETQITAGNVNILTPSYIRAEQAAQQEQQEQQEQEELPPEEQLPEDGELWPEEGGLLTDEWITDPTIPTDPTVPTDPTLPDTQEPTVPVDPMDPMSPG